jgi:hypothetical protein
MAVEYWFPILISYMCCKFINSDIIYQSSLFPKIVINGNWDCSYNSQLSIMIRQSTYHQFNTVHFPGTAYKIIIDAVLD